MSRVRPFRRSGPLTGLVVGLTVLAFAATSCSAGPLAWGIPTSGSSDADLGPVRINFNPPCVGMPTAGRLKIEVTSTAGVDPNRVSYRYIADPGWIEGVMSGPVDHRFEAITGFPYAQGQCPAVEITVGCDLACPEWQASSKTFDYRVTIVA